MSELPTLVFFHAHPDDEASATSGTMSLASDKGHRVVVVYATNGDHGIEPEELAPGETIVEHRRREAEASAAITGTAAVHWLDYADSGMTGWEQNDADGNFHNADIDEAAARLARILDAEDADVLIGYDWHGGYGHPDHIKVHTVAQRALELATRRPRELQTTMNRDRMKAMVEQAQRAGMDEGWDPDAPGDDGTPMGTPEAELHWQVDVSSVIERKRAALECHASQTSDVGMMLAMPREAFHLAFGMEHYIEPGREPGMSVGWPF